MKLNKQFFLFLMSFSAINLMHGAEKIDYIKLNEEVKERFYQRYQDTFKSFPSDIIRDHCLQNPTTACWQLAAVENYCKEDNEKRIKSTQRVLKEINAPINGEDFHKVYEKISKKTNII